MAFHFRSFEPGAYYFITTTIKNWIDLFTREHYSNLLLESWVYCRHKKGLKIHAFCIMSNHVHAIMSTATPIPIGDIIRDWKSFTARQVIKSLQVNYEESRRHWLLKVFSEGILPDGNYKKSQVWQPGYHPILLDSEEKIEQRLNYIHHNPVKAGLVNCPTHWRFSSASHFYGEDCVLELDPIVT